MQPNILRDESIEFNHNKKSLENLKLVSNQPEPTFNCPINDFQCFLHKEQYGAFDLDSVKFTKFRQTMNNLQRF